MSRRRADVDEVEATLERLDALLQSAGLSDSALGDAGVADPTDSEVAFYDGSMAAEVTEDTLEDEVVEKRKPTEYFWRISTNLLQAYLSLPGVIDLEKVLYDHLCMVIRDEAPVVHGRQIHDYENALEGLDPDFLHALVVRMFLPFRDQEADNDIIGQGHSILVTRGISPESQNLDGLDWVIEQSQEFWTHNKSRVTNLLELTALRRYVPLNSERILLTRLIFLRHIFSEYVRYLNSEL